MTKKKLKRFDILMRELNVTRKEYKDMMREREQQQLKNLKKNLKRMKSW